MQDLSEVLSQLRDIHEPAPIGWWPPTTAWWILVVGIICLIGLTVYFFSRYKRSFRRVATVECENIVRDFEIHHDKNQLVKDISIYLRRLALKKDKHLAAGLTGQRWIQYLQDLSGDNALVSQYANLLVSAPYQANIEYDSTALLKDLRMWVKKLK